MNRSVPHVIAVAVLSEQQTRLQQALQTAQLAATQAQTGQRESAPLVQQAAHLAHANLDRLTQTLGDQQGAGPAGSTGLCRGQQALNQMNERQQQGAERLEHIARQLEQSAARPWPMPGTPIAHGCSNWFD